MTTWTPISTPPTTAGRYLVFAPSDVGGHMDAVYWDERAGFGGAPCWTRGWTHWMVLPAEPEVGGLE